MSFARLANLKILRPPIEVGPAEVKQHWHARFHRDQGNCWLRGVIAELFLNKPWGAIGRERTVGLRAALGERPTLERGADHASPQPARSKGGGPVVGDGGSPARPRDS
jgi:hypothetical protein